MDRTFEIVLPVFGLIAIGYAVAAARLLPRRTGESLSDFVFVVAIPVLIFRTIAVADFAGASPWRLWLPFFAVFALTWFIGSWMAKAVFHRDARIALIAGISAAYGNAVLIGIPLALTAFGNDGAVPMALIIAIHLPIMMGASAALIVRAEHVDGVGPPSAGRAAAAKTVLLSLVTHPIIIGILIGILWRLIGLPLGGVGGALVERIGDIAAPLALLAMGMNLRRYGISGNVRFGAVLALLKLVVMPALVFVLVRYVVPMPPSWAKVAVLAAACPTGVNSYLVAARFGIGHGLASNAITLSTAFAVATISVWLTIVQAAW